MKKLFGVLSAGLLAAGLTLAAQGRSRSPFTPEPQAGSVSCGSGFCRKATHPIGFRWAIYSALRLTGYCWSGQSREAKLPP